MVFIHVMARFVRCCVRFVTCRSSSSFIILLFFLTDEFHKLVVFSDHLIVLHLCRCPICSKRDQKDDTVHTCLPLFLHSSFVIISHTFSRYHGFLQLLAR